MKRQLTLAVYGVALLVALECPVLLAQTERANPVWKASDLSVQTCDSLKKLAPGESLADAANRHKAWWHCLETEESGAGRFAGDLSKPVDIDNGRLVAGAVPRLVESQSPPATRTDTYVNSSSPIRPPFTFTIGSGPQSNVISASQILRESRRLLAKLRLTRKTPQLSIQ